MAYGGILVAQTTFIPSESPARDVLTRAEAEARARRVSGVAYELAIDLPREGGSYEGRARLTFAQEGRDPLFIDFRGGEIQSLSVNGQAVEPDVRDNRLWLGPDQLRPRMDLELVYRNRYDDSGDGLHHFIDPEDGEPYVYSNFQPFAAHRLFPCFDQPDLKATYDLRVTAPADWEVVAATPILASETQADGRRHHRFARSATFSTYLLPLVAGPYEIVRTEHRGIPLGLYGRRSLARQLEHDAHEMFEITRQGFDYYSELFDQPYPFTKYDQLFMPEFNIGAMENVAAVTFHDGYLFRDPPTDTQRQERAEVILHELAHMWFGNLVTMRWWDDLWLNESFATYISFLALTQATRFAGAWKSFNGSVKLYAYRQDRLVTTHPISADASDTERALLNFDDITYGKGASVLKQLVATIGQDGFREGMRTYFRRHAWGSATLADFMAALEEGSGRDLDRWAELWLETASLNTIAADWAVSDGHLATMSLTQTAPAGFPTMRPHAMRVAMLSDGVGRVQITSVPAQIDGPRGPVDGVAGTPAPLLVYPNHDDHDYALASLDPASLAFARERLGEVDDPLLRQLLWTSLWDMVWEVKLSSTQFLEACRRLLPAEPDLELVDSVLDRVSQCLGAYVPESRRLAEAAALVQTALGVLRTTEAADARILWMRQAIAAAATPADLAPLLALVDGDEVIEGFTVDQDMRWGLAAKAIAFGIADAEGRLALEAERDRSDRGARALIKAGASRPTEASKEETWTRIHREGYGSYHLTRAAMQGFMWHQQRELVGPYEERFFERVREIFATHDHPFARSYVLNLFPDRWAEPGVLDRARSLLGELTPEETALERQLREKIDGLERSIGARALAEGSAPAP
jgi:aminopeptidase N